MALDLRGLEHKPISLAKKEIRLLEIYTAHDVLEPISSRLATYKITPELEYIGLCALLRDEENPGTEKIWVNGSKVTIPRTVGQALRHVRGLFLSQKAAQATAGGGPAWLQNFVRGFRYLLPDEASRAGRDAPLRVWLDCICIDPRNAAETENRRAHVALAYESAKMTIGWLGMKDPTSDLAISTVRELEQRFPPHFGDPQDKIDHPENYSPIMRFLTPFGPTWEADSKVNGSRERGPVFIAVRNFVNRPFFTRQWILEELTLSSFPAFLLGDEIISWRQLLVWNRVEGKSCSSLNHAMRMFVLLRTIKSADPCLITSVEFEKAGCEGFSKETFEAIKALPKMDFGVIFTLLDAFERRRSHAGPRVPWG
ncbi:hypothetical protein BD289DRAFT_366372 [Coniella lustricola]|uniref:Heterokaryon incompatibility domain-containing protein n=1 Tax=Coniella lustricola TaxID=2025994 RepID=A0A2T3AB76_9PEZI|nr:hypothetical protein BD289DRAFT_366372 [Coniella lustricola]